MAIRQEYSRSLDGLGGERQEHNLQFVRKLLSIAFSRELRTRLFPNVRYCESAVVGKFYLRLKQTNQRLDRLE